MNPDPKILFSKGRRVFELIEQVQKYPCLWNLNDRSHTNKLHRAIAWKNIVRQFYPDFDNYTPTDKNMLCEEFKKRWNNVRDSYRKYVSKTSHLPPDTPEKKFVYKDSLSFLLPYLFQARKSANVSVKVEILSESDNDDGTADDCKNNVDESEGDDDDCEEKDEDVDEDNLIEIKTEQPSTNPYIEIIDPINVNRKRTRKSENEFFIAENPQSNTIDPTTDEDCQFLLSFRSDMRLMSRAQKLNFKIGVIKLIQSILEGQGNEMPCSSS